MRKVYLLGTCDTCKKILKEVNLPENFIKQDIKNQEITVKELEEMFTLSGSYESLFSRRAKLYKERNLKDEKLQERDFKNLILEHYTFLNRPVIINNSEIFIGNSRKMIEDIKKSIND